jgi:hypothetical protein
MFLKYCHEKRKVESCGHQVISDCKNFTVDRGEEL